MEKEKKVEEQTTEKDVQNNMIIYEQIKEVPKEAQKKIKAGRLKDMTDIKPMWRIQKLTEMFGICGFGWKAPIKNKEIIEGANGEKIAVVDIDLYIKIDDVWSEPIEGTGGSSFIAKEKNGLYTSDECFKMAYTDAISVACKSLGMGADVYWGDSKYDKSGIDTLEEAREIEITFGKNKDKKLGFIYDAGDINYLKWLLKETKDETIKKAVEILFEKSLATDEQIEKLQELVEDIPAMLYYYKVGKIEELTYKQAEETIERKSKK